MVDDMSHFINENLEEKVFHIHWPSGMKTTMRYHYLSEWLKVVRTPTFCEVERIRIIQGCWQNIRWCILFPIQEAVWQLLTGKINCAVGHLFPTAPKT